MYGGRELWICRRFKEFGVGGASGWEIEEQREVRLGIFLAYSYLLLYSVSSYITHTSVYSRSETSLILGFFNKECSMLQYERNVSIYT